MAKRFEKREKRHRVHGSYYEYVENVVNKCGHKYLILDSKGFRSYRMEKESNPKAKLPGGKLIKVTPAKCKSYSCPICGKKKVMDLVEKLKTVNLKNYRFFTLTLKNRKTYDDTEKNLKRISDCFNKLNNKIRKLPGYKGLEYFRVTEISKDGLVHIHGIWNKFIKQETLSAMWLAITKDSYRVKLERIKNKRDAVQYLFKYLTKDVAKKDMLLDPKLFNMDLQNAAALFYENNKRRWNASRNFFPKTGKKVSEFLPFWFESSDTKTVENTMSFLVKTYDLKLEHFDLNYYFGSDLFIENLFQNKEKPPG